MSYTRSSAYQVHCLMDPIQSSIVWGGMFSALDVAQGRAFSLQRVGGTMGAIYLYNALQCPMEAIHGQRSLLHNVGSAGIIGYIGHRAGVMGIPFVDPMLFYRYPSLQPSVVCAAVYGAIAGTMAGVLGGKPL